MSLEIHVNQQCARTERGTTLFDAAEALGIRVPTSCRKQGKCKECIVEVTEGGDLLSARTDAERHLRGDFRLSCCTHFEAAGGIVRYHTMRRGRLRIENLAYELPVREAGWKPDPTVTREGERILLDGEEIDRRSGAIHGLALDLGTTTVVARLLDLESGELVADSAFENPQRFGGSEVMARIQFDTDDGTRSLQRTLLGYLNHAIEELPVEARSIYEVVIAGNSTMRDLFFRLSVRSIGQSPYHSVTEEAVAAGERTTTALSTSASKLGLAVHPRARVYGMPIISGHVGADTAACMLAINLAHEDRLVALMDIGTNTELILGNRHKLLAASCPAGPAFEGGEVAFGMPGLPGAIERARLDDDLQFHCEVIGGGTAEGICGSGMVDVLSELLRQNQMNALGRLGSGRREVVLESRSDPPITFSGSDINALAQAKGANVAGLRILLEEFGVHARDLDVFYLAGGFGRHLDLASAKRIGLLPDLPDAKIRRVGNAAIEGACIALLSRTKREELETLVRRARHCRLETHEAFFDAFVEGCHFTPFGHVEGATAG
ncbi:MAG: ASKHA domain-containing protein [Verrucomicrobiota bacterium]